MSTVNFSLTYDGNLADQHGIDLYDIGQALIGFQRSLALTTHLILNDEIITQAPALKGAAIAALPPENGSWKVTAVVAMLGTAAYNLGTAPKDTPLGHLVRSAYDYVISETLGFHVDFDKTLGVQYEQIQKSGITTYKLDQNRFDSLIEKCETAVREMHRPIIASKTACQGTLAAIIGSNAYPIKSSLTAETYDYIRHTETTDSPAEFRGRVSSYNLNTYKGRVYLPQQNRPVPFELAEGSRTIGTIQAIIASLQANAIDRAHGDGEIYFNAFSNLSRTGRLKSLMVTGAQKSIVQFR